VRFLLDNDVDAGVGRVLRKAGHDCWTASQAGLAGPESAPDDALSIYAQQKEAVVVTHDREFSLRRRAMTTGDTCGCTASNPTRRRSSTVTSPSSSPGWRRRRTWWSSSAPLA
jgi:hypothetical protein